MRGGVHRDELFLGRRQIRTPAWQAAVARTRQTARRRTLPASGARRALSNRISRAPHRPTRGAFDSRTFVLNDRAVIGRSRELPDRRHDQRRRDGHRLPRRAHAARPPRRGEDPATPSCRRAATSSTASSTRRARRPASGTRASSRSSTSATCRAGHAYIVMEFLDGETLSARIAQRGPMPEGEAARSLARRLQRAGGGARQGHRPPRPQARQHLPGPRSRLPRSASAPSCSTSASPS